MSRFKQKLSRFMIGRYGSDQLNNALMIFYLLLAVVNAFVQSIALYIVMLVPIIVVFVRMFSRNIYTRRRENDRFLRVWYPVKNFFKLIYSRLRDRKTHVYRKCPKCRAALRLPKKTGDHSVRCPKCGNSFGVHI